MEISANSWHFKLIRDAGWTMPTNLCPYFWRVLAALARKIFLWSFVVIVASLIAGFVLCVAVCPFLLLVNMYVTPFLDGINPDHYNFIEGMGVMGFVLYGLAGLVASVLFIGGKVSQHKHSSAALLAPPKPPGLVKQRYLDWKNKTCTQIKFVDVPKPHPDDTYPDDEVSNGVA